MDVRSLGYRRDLMIGVLEGGRIEDRGDCLVIGSPHDLVFWWGNFLLLPALPAPGRAGERLARFAAEFPGACQVAPGAGVTEADAVDPREMTASQVHAPPRASAEARYRRLCGDDDWRQAAGLHAGSHR